ncbi:MAG TPA: DegT/DnrJ/EryC1/StrS family aminotransferase [Nevskiaceae bacterium]|nr:DegT/DnrJ/EryC1/StrS family aminotransferase [Nevskiaceae bacterium]
MTAPGIPFLDLAAVNARHLDAYRAAFERVAARSQWVLGAEVEAFEAEFAAYCGTRHAVGVANGLDALELVLRAWGIGPGDEVLVPSRTFVATWMAVSLTGATPRSVPCDDATHVMDPRALDAAVSPRCKVVIPVHLYGRPADMTAIGAVARHHGLRVLEDAAQAHGASWRGVRAGALGDAAAFSFYPGKNLGALGDGGAVTTDDDTLAAALRRWRNYGSARRYEHEQLGRNSRLDELQAAFLRTRLAALDADNAHRVAIAARYAQALAGIPGLTLPATGDPGARSVWHLYVVRHPRRDELASRLADEGIGTHVHYPAVPAQQAAYPAHAEAVDPSDAAAAATVLSLPIGPTVTASEVDRVAAALRRASAALA